MVLAFLVNFHVYYSCPLSPSNLTFLPLTCAVTLKKVSFEKLSSPQATSAPHEDYVIGHCWFNRWKILGTFAYTNSDRQVISSPISSHIQLYRGKIIRITQAMLWQQNNNNLNKQFIEHFLFCNIYHTLS